MDVGKRFKYFREKLNMTQSEAAAKIGVKNYQLGNYETNRSEPNITTLKRMSALYGVSIDKLLGNRCHFEEEPLPESETINIGELVEKLNGIAAELSALAVENKLE